MSEVSNIEKKIFERELPHNGLFSSAMSSIRVSSDAVTFFLSAVVFQIHRVRNASVIVNMIRIK